MADPKGLRAAAAKLGVRLDHEDSIRNQTAAQARDAESTAIRDKYRRIAEYRRYPKKKTYSWEELVVGSMAMDAGVNRYYAMKAGRQAKKALDYLSQAVPMTSPKAKAKALKLARTHLAEVSRAHHPELVEQIESRLLWEEGWRPETWDAERNAPRAQGPSINPQTGQQEFFSPGRLWDNTFGRLMGSAEAAESQPQNAEAIPKLEGLDNLQITGRRSFEGVHTAPVGEPGVNQRTAVRIPMKIQTKEGLETETYLDAEFARRAQIFDDYARSQGVIPTYNSGYRTPEYQKDVDSGGRPKAKYSLHSAGLALDTNYNALEPHERRVLQEAAKQAELKWGKAFDDKPHFYYEPLGMEAGTQSRIKGINDFTRAAEELRKKKK